MFEKLKKGYIYKVFLYKFMLKVMIDKKLAEVLITYLSKLVITVAEAVGVVIVANVAAVDVVVAAGTEFTQFNVHS